MNCMKDIMTNKVCEYCGKAFQAQRKHTRFCCTNCQKRNWEAKNKERFLESVKKYRKQAQEHIKEHNIQVVLDNPQYYIWRNARYRAKTKNIPFDIEVEDIKIPDVCPVLQLPLKFKVGTTKGGASDNSPSLDRVNPSLGYTKGNVRVISYKANRLKSDATLEELELILKDLRSIGCIT